MSDTNTLIDKTPAKQAGMTPEGWLTDSWYLGAVSAEIKAGKQERRILLGHPVVIGRGEGGEAFALRDICPHRLVPLSAGRQVETDGETTLECPYHGWRFGTDGVCKKIPSLTGDEPYEPSRVKVRRYPVHEANGVIFVFMAGDPRFDGEPRAPVPDFGPLPETPKFVVEDILSAEMDSAIERHRQGSDSKLYRWGLGKDADTEIRFQLPGFHWDTVSNDRARRVTLTCLTPETPNRTRITQFTWWTGAPLLSLTTPLAKSAARKSLHQDVSKIDTQDEWYQTLKKEWVTSRTEN